MGWMDRLLGKVSQIESVTGRKVSDSAIESSVAGGLSADYDLAFKNAASTRAIQADEKKTNAYTALQREQMANERAMFYDRMDFMKDTQNQQNIGNMVQAGLTIVPKAITSAADYFAGKAAIASTESYVPGVTAIDSAELGIGAGAATGAVTGGTLAATSAFGSTAGASIMAGTIGTEAAIGTIGADIVSSFGTSASIAAAANTGVAAGVAQASEAAALGLWSSAQAGVTSAATTAAGAAAATATETSMLTMLSSSLSTVGAFVPFAGLALMGMGFVAPELTGKITDTIGDIGETIWEAISAPFSGSVVCTELHRQGYIPWDVLMYENIARIKYLSEGEYKGYLKIFTPVANRMKTSKLLTKIMKPFGVGVARELASKVSYHKGSTLGKITLALGLPVCSLVNKMNKMKERIYGCHKCFGWSR
jgi:hypothetical protein